MIEKDCEDRGEVKIKMDGQKRTHELVRSRCPLIIISTQKRTVSCTAIFTTIVRPAGFASLSSTLMLVTLLQKAQKNSIVSVTAPHFLHVTPSPFSFTRKSPPQ